MEGGVFKNWFNCLKSGFSFICQQTERNWDPESGERPPQVQRQRHADGHAGQDCPAALRDLQHILVLLAPVAGAVIE